jgi:hypothetical protein
MSTEAIEQEMIVKIMAIKRLTEEGLQHLQHKIKIDLLHNHSNKIKIVNIK